MNDSSDVVSSFEPDWKRESVSLWSWAPELKLINVLRAYQSSVMSNNRRRLLPLKFLKGVFVIRHRFWSVVSGADIPLNSQIGGGLIIRHGQGVVIHPQAKIGVNCLIMSQVVIGATEKKDLPIIGGHVDMGAGAKILGPVKVGDHVKIGANAVVVDDVPDYAIVAGVPAKVIRIARV